MNGTSRLWLCLLLCLATCPVMSGCGPRKVRVHGKLTYGAKPFSASEREPIVLTFCPYNGEGKPDGPHATAEVNQEAGTYEAVVLAGKQRVCVSYYREGLQDMFDGAFAPGQSPILRDIDGDTELDLDLKELLSRAQRGSANVPVPGASP